MMLTHYGKYRIVAPMRRKSIIGIPLDEEERRLLDEEAERRTCSRASILRLLIRTHLAHPTDSEKRGELCLISQNSI